MYSCIPCKKWTLIISVLFFLFTISCKNPHKSDLTETALYDTDEFKEFYHKFSTDSVYQMEHIVFPLEGMKSPTDSVLINPESFRWNADDWVLHGEYDDSGDFSRELVAVSGIVFEFISDPTETFTMERRFANLSSGWHLIYYRELGKYK